MIAAFGFLIILYLALIVFIIAAYWKIYSKAGQPGWACVLFLFTTGMYSQKSSVNPDGGW